MSTLLLEHIKKQTSTFLHEKYKIARMAFTDVTAAELLAEQATNKDPCSPDAKTMTKIAEASFDIDDYWRIVDVLHQRLYNFNLEEWRRSYKALVLLEFLLTHGPEDFAIEFQCDTDVIEELGSFTHIDERGFNWGARMQNKSDQVLKLLQGGTTLREARLRALKITNEIYGFGSSMDSPSSTSTCSSSSEAQSCSSSFWSFSGSSTPTYDDSINNELSKHQYSPTKLGTSISHSQGGIGDENDIAFPKTKTVNNNDEGNHLWDGPASSATEEIGYLMDSENEDDEKPQGFVSGICSKLIGGAGAFRGSGEKIEFRCLSDVGKKGAKKKFDRQYSLGY